MDVRLLSGMIGDLMLQTDSLSLPGLGTFTAEEMPATFSDRGFSVNPPYRRLSFTSRQTQDGQLAALYAASNEGLSQEDAESIIGSFCESLKEELGTSKTVDFPGLGRLRATREGQLFFVSDPDLDISPDACGLVSVSLKSHSAAMPSLPLAETLPVRPAAPAPVIVPEAEEPQTIPEAAKTQILDQKLAESIPEPEIADQVGNDAPVAPKSANEAEASGRSERAEEKTKEKAPKRKMSKGLRWAIGLSCAAAALLIAFVVVSRLAPEFTDKLLYTPEQLQILNTPIEDGTGLPG